ncbi:hypothetical protein HNY73_001626 [Argiope bruennichi]|uniref:Uncharacterized protein n=1 Tax=Argiope bruennichi TaxID=94029 RepID=A0A8T0FTM8_ARGBR|nr:hypothetical protein HNY73_001626 [Argiope bruennichi]
MPSGSFASIYMSLAVILECDGGFKRSLPRSVSASSRDQGKENKVEIGCVIWFPLAYRNLDKGSAIRSICHLN